MVAFELLRRDKCTLGVGYEAFSDARTKRPLVNNRRRVSSCIFQDREIHMPAARSKIEQRLNGGATLHHRGMKGLVSLSLFEVRYDFAWRFTCKRRDCRTFRRWRRKKGESAQREWDKNLEGSMYKSANLLIREFHEFIVVEKVRGIKNDGSKVWSIGSQELLNWSSFDLDR